LLRLSSSTRRRIPGEPIRKAIGVNNKISGTLLAMSLALAIGTQASANDYAYGFSPRTGDVYVDGQLGEINRYARADSAGFIEDLAVNFGVPRSLVREYYTDRRWAPGDIYYGCALAHQLRRPCGEVLNMYEQDRGQGWGVIAQRLGIKPGSPEFHALKGRVGQGHGHMKGKGAHPQADGPSRPSTDAGPGNSGDKGPANARGEDKGKGKGKDKDKGGR